MEIDDNTKADINRQITENTDRITGLVNKMLELSDEFVQLDEYYDGTCIGLTVARSPARRLGGDIVLDTTYTDGARFVMTLPL
jgi:signal transduction histidine kinase